MKAAFTPGTKVRFNIADGGLAKVTDFVKSWGWKVPGYLGDGFYLVETIPEQRRLVAHEDELVLETETCENYRKWLCKDRPDKDVSPCMTCYERGVRSPAGEGEEK